MCILFCQTYQSCLLTEAPEIESELYSISLSDSGSGPSSSSLALFLPLSPFSSVQFSSSVVSDSLRPHESQHTRPPCPSPTPRVYPNSCPLSQWCHPAISFCCRLLVLPPIPPSIRVFSNKSTFIQKYSLNILVSHSIWTGKTNPVSPAQWWAHKQCSENTDELMNKLFDMFS